MGPSLSLTRPVGTAVVFLVLVRTGTTYLAMIHQRVNSVEPGALVHSQCRKDHKTEVGVAVDAFCHFHLLQTSLPTFPCIPLFTFSQGNLRDAAQHVK